MPELPEFINHNFRTDTEARDTVSSENLSYFKVSDLSPYNAQGVCFTENIQLIVFIALPDSFDIDFVIQELQVGAIYVIPPDHKFHISPNSSCQYYCFDISVSVLDKQFRQLLNAIAYEKYKDVTPNNHSDFINWIENLNSNNSIIGIFEHLKRVIMEGFYGNANLAYIEIAEEQFNLANRFLDLLLKNNFNKELSIKYCAAKLGCCTRSLQRACLKNYKVEPQQMIKHHLFVQSLRLLSDKNDTIEKVALKLGYSTHNAFCKFTKTYIDLTPLELRRKLLYSNPNV